MCFTTNINRFFQRSTFQQSFTKNRSMKFWFHRGLHQAHYVIILTIIVALARHCWWDSAYSSICMKNQFNKAVEYGRWSHRSCISFFSFSLVFLVYELKHETWCFNEHTQNEFYLSTKIIFVFKNNSGTVSTNMKAYHVSVSDPMSGN